MTCTARSSPMVPETMMKGMSSCALLHDLEGAQRVELRHGEIGENDLGRRLQVVPVILLGLHPIGDRIVAGTAQRVQHQLGVGGIVFENQ